jgi:hypothetical protein
MQREPFAQRLRSGYNLCMNVRLLPFLTGVVFAAVITPGLLADQVEMQNGDRLSGKVLSVSADTVVLKSDVLGKINVPRKNIAALAFGTNVVAATAPAKTPRVPAPAPSSAAASSTALLETNADFAAAFHSPGADTNVIRQVREQMLAGNPAAAAKFDELADGLMSGKLNMDDLRREAKASADQLRELKRENPEAGDSLDAYLQVLDNFLSEPADQPANATPSSPQPKSQTP